MTATLEPRAPETDFCRSLPFEVERAESDGDGLTMTGYAAVFNQPARITDRTGEFDEVILPGAFAESLKRTTPVLMFDHGQHPLIGSIPIGRYTSLSEDDHGLHVEARLHNNWLTEPIRDAISEKSVTGMSFRFMDPVDKWTDRPGDVPLRSISSMSVPEAGPVVFPAYTGTQVAVRSLAKLAERPEAAEWLEELVAELRARKVPTQASGGTPGSRKATRSNLFSDVANYGFLIDPDDFKSSVSLTPVSQVLTGQSVARSDDGGVTDATAETEASPPISEERQRHIDALVLSLKVRRP